MGKTPEQTFFPKKYADGQQAHEKMLGITNHMEMQIEAMSYHFTPVVITSVGKDVEKRDPLYIIYGNINWCSHYEKQ